MAPVPAPAAVACHSLGAAAPEPGSFVVSRWCQQQVAATRADVLAMRAAVGMRVDARLRVGEGLKVGAGMRVVVPCWDTWSL